MALIDDLADNLARDTIEAMEKFGNDRLYVDVSRVLGASSTTLQEAFLTSIRLRLAERRGRKFLEAAITAAETGATAPEAPKDLSIGH
ncbi:hypothetical protein L0V05_13895 [Tabrizicola sp. J26]|uniref:hypothetical protein n=1 Tax=Alitabrizicola rongguiensis TaxID=2909234 RepID=UPI001F492700|nr:hypothetical protein [Tabrizicola rongguiensis]MCF1709908.1 hypothetical protein [Tabrizicola rongguiensis]